MYSYVVYFIFIIFCSDNSSTLTWYTYLFPQNNFTNGSSNSTGEPCCNTKVTESRCSRKFCNCSIEEQIKCYINGSNLDRSKLSVYSYVHSNVCTY